MATSQSTAHTGTPAEGRAFPPFQSESFPSQILWLVIAFVALYLLMSRIALPQVGAIIDARKSRIDGDLADAERLKAESDAALAGYEKSLAEARSRAQALAAQAHQQQAAEAEAHRKTLEAQLNSRIASAEQSIAQTRIAAMTNVQSIAMDAASAIVEQLIGRTPAPSEVANAVTDALKR